jgi:hypothetical protein
MNMMRLVVGVLACLGAGAATVAVADPSSPAPQQPAAASSSSATAPPATTAASATQTAPSATSATQAPAAEKPEVDPEEKRLLAQGYRAKMRHGQKVFCRTEPELGSRLGGQEICATVADLKAHQASTREEVQRQQRTNMMTPAGK